MANVRKADSLLPVLRPSHPQPFSFPAPRQGHVERIGGVSRPVAEALEAGVVLVPLLGDSVGSGAKLLLLEEGSLLVVGAIERVKVTEELQRVRLNHVPRR